MQFTVCEKADQMDHALTTNLYMSENNTVLLNTNTKNEPLCAHQDFQFILHFSLFPNVHKPKCRNVRFNHYEVELHRH